MADEPLFYALLAIIALGIWYGSPPGPRSYPALTT